MWYWLNLIQHSIILGSVSSKANFKFGLVREYIFSLLYTKIFYFFNTISNLVNFSIIFSIFVLQCKSMSPFIGLKLRCVLFSVHETLSCSYLWFCIFHHLTWLLPWPLPWPLPQPLLHIANAGPERIQYKCLDQIYEFPKWNYFQNIIILFCLPVPTLIYLWEMYIYLHAESAYSAAGNYVDWSWE